LTGGCGFIGSEVARQLVPLAERITILDNLAVGKRSNLPDPLPNSMELVVADVRNRQDYHMHLRDCDAVFHLACLGVRHSIHSPRENHEVNATGTMELLRATQAKGVGRFVYVSSSEVYGTARHTPMDESHPTIPATVYGASKLAGECYTRAFWQTYELPTVVLAAPLQHLRSPFSPRGRFRRGDSQVHAALHGRKAVDRVWGRQTDPRL
jgi:UDP-glucose 4-epimerase